MLDALAATTAGLAALSIRFGTIRTTSGCASCDVLSAAFAPAWVLILLLGRAYESRYVGAGSEEFRRVGNAAVRFIAVVATLSYAFKIELARGYVAIALPLAALLTFALRYAARLVLHRVRSHGGAAHQLVVVGDRDHVEQLVAQLRRDPYAGYAVVGVCWPREAGDQASDLGVPVLGSLTTAARSVVASGANAVAVTASPGVTSAALRTLSWELEGTGVDLLVAPSLADVAGPRISIRQVAGLPLLHVDEPELSGGRRVIKAVFDRTVAALALVLLSPLLLVLSVVIRASSPGQALFRQVRVGIHGKTFTLYKLRTMVRDAEQLRAGMSPANESDGLLFKMRGDPRVTRCGRVLRRYSLDELPQLWNVLRGDMSLVGPRPPLWEEVVQYEEQVRRRLLVKPGLTGLWQVSGRSDLSWEESVRLDLSYVENWSLAADLLIIYKTIFAVLARHGAY